MSAHPSGPSTNPSPTRHPSLLPPCLRPAASRLTETRAAVRRTSVDESARARTPPHGVGTSRTSSQVQDVVRDVPGVLAATLPVDNDSTSGADFPTLEAEVQMAVPMAALPEHERPRERLVAQGSGALSDRELLALVLRNGTRGESALDLASGLLADYGTLSALAAALPEELERRPGVGAAKSAALVAAFQLGRRAATPVAAGLVLRSPDDIVIAARSQLVGRRRERVVVLVCDGANRLRQTVVVAEGSTDRSLVPVREILNAVVRHDGKAFAVAHNHPSGDPTPSDADLQASSQLAAGSKTVGCASSTT